MPTPVLRVPIMPLVHSPAEIFVPLVLCVRSCEERFGIDIFSTSAVLALSYIRLVPGSLVTLATVLTMRCFFSFGVPPPRRCASRRGCSSGASGYSSASFSSSGIRCGLLDLWFRKDAPFCFRVASLGPVAEMGLNLRLQGG